MKVLGILPARSGSKGIPGKNIKTTLGKPLLYWASKALLDSPSVYNSICSTDDPNIAEKAEEIGLKIPFIRPKKLSTDNAKVVDVVLHAINKIDPNNSQYTHIVLVQATSPTVTSEHVERGIRLAKETSCDTVISGYKYNGINPSIMFTIDNGFVNSVLPNEKFESRRQDHSEIFIRTGLLYVIKISSLLQKKSIYGDTIQAIIISEEDASAIDDINDYTRAVKQLESKHGK